MQAVYVCSVSSAREVLAKVEFHPEHQQSPRSQSSCVVYGKVDTGAMVSCFPLSLLSKIGLSRKVLMPSKVILKGVSKKRLQNYGTMVMEVTCNSRRAKAKFYVTDSNSHNDVLLGLNFCKAYKLVNIADTCIQREITAKSEQTSRPEQTHASSLHILPLRLMRSVQSTSWRNLKLPIHLF